MAVFDKAVRQKHISFVLFSEDIAKLHFPGSFAITCGHITSPYVKNVSGVVGVIYRPKHFKSGCNSLSPLLPPLPAKSGYNRKLGDDGTTKWGVGPKITAWRKVTSLNRNTHFGLLQEQNKHLLPLRSIYTFVGLFVTATNISLINTGVKSMPWPYSHWLITQWNTEYVLTW